MSGTFTLSDIAGAPATSIGINCQFDFLGKNTKLVGTKSISYAPIEDGLVEKKIVKEEEGNWWENLGKGLLTVAAVAAVGAIAVLAAPAAIVGVVTAVAIGATVGAAVSVAAIQITDAISGKPRTWEEAFEDIMMGTLRGAISGAMFYYLAPASLAGYIGTGMLDGAVGSLVEQSILGEGINIEQMLEEAILEGIFCGLLYGAGKLFGRVVAKFKGKSGSKTGKLTIIDGGDYSTSEINAAQYMADLGNDVVLRPPVGTRADGGTSDLLVNGVNYDVYTPTTSNPSAIIRAITKKNTQTTGVVLDLSSTTVTADDLGNILARVKGAIEKNGGTCNINDIVVMPK